VHQMAAAIDREKREVRLADGTTLAYDRLVVSPGIDLKYDSVPGWGKEHEEAMPHAWKAGPQTTLLKAKLDAVPDGGVIVMIAPPNPYRCPPGPYERVSMMAHALKKAGKTKAKVVVIDPKTSFSKQALFQEGWDKHYPGMVEWINAKIYETLKSVVPKTNSVETGFETYKNAALINVIPAQMAGKIARDAGLANNTGYCPIDPANMRSAADANIYIVGDACIAGDMPKSAFSANSQAKVAAMTVRGDLAGAQTFPARYTNTCWSLIETDDTVKVGGRYEAKDGKIAAVDTFVSQKDESAALRKQTQEENMGWYSGITADMFS
jgi:sulfide dehydrogenase [flavocytochrome c] flavoprotein chain